MRSKEQTKDEMDRNEAIRTEAHRAWCDARERGETAPLDDLDHREGLARAWCEEHKREIDAGGLTADDAVDALIAGDMYRVDTMSAGYDMIIDAADEDDALYAVADFAGRLRGTPAGHVIDEELTRGWTAKRVTL